MRNDMMTASQVLVVEDTAAIRDVVQIILEDAGYRVTVAAHGAAALAVLQEEPRLPDLTLLDLRMPVMDGCTFRRHQQANPGWCTIPVGVMSAEREVHATAAAVGVAGVLPKPFTVPELLAAVERYAR